MRLMVAIIVMSLPTPRMASACPLEDMFRFCIVYGDRLDILHQGAAQGRWALYQGDKRTPPLSGPFTGNELSTMPSRLQFFVSYQNYTDLFSSTCSLNFAAATIKKEVDALRCSPPELADFEAALSAASLGKLTKERRPNGATYLIEGHHRWMTAFVSNEDAAQGLVNGWVETSVLHPDRTTAARPGIR
jgi:hypothetical protein